MNHWLMKSEPDAFSIDDLAAVDSAPWDGVRNYQARNMLNEMQAGDLFLFYHSSCQPPGLAGIGEIVRPAYPDRSALDPNNPYHDPKTDEQRLPWKAVDVRFREKFPALLSLKTLRTLAGLEELPLLQRASRLSVMPVSTTQWDIMVAAARQG